MSIAELYRDLRSQWLALSHFLWPDTPREQAEADLVRLTEELRRRQQGLLRRCRRIEQLRADLARQERAIARLTAEVQRPTNRAEDAAWQTALSLDRLHQARARLEHHQMAYERQRQRFQLRKQLWAQKQTFLSGAGPDSQVSALPGGAGDETLGVR